MNENDISSEGVKPHTCTVDIVSNRETTGDQIKIKKNAKAIEMYLPFNGSGIVSIIDVKGRVLSSFRTTGKRKWYSISKEQLSGVVIVSVKNSSKIVNKKFCLIR